MSRAAIRYAKAMLSLASDQKLVDVVNDDMHLIANTIKGSQELSDMLQSPVIPSSIKKSVLLEVFKKSNKATLNLVDALIANNRINLLGEIAVKYNDLFDQSKGIAKATVITSVPLTSVLEKKVLAKAKEISGKSIELENIIDQSILGGFVLRVDDIQYDASVSNQLNKLKKEFTLN